MISYCGSICTDCPCYLVTKTKDYEIIEKLVMEAKQMHNNPDATAEMIQCEGCLCENNKQLYQHCRKCKIRLCGKNRGVINCAYCDDYICDILNELVISVPELKITLDNLNQTIC